MSFLKKYFYIIIIFISITSIISSKNNFTKKKRILFPNPVLNLTTKDSKNLKFHSKLVQTLYANSISKNNYYYTTLYIGSDHMPQTFIIDTGSSIMSSPCSKCLNNSCGIHKNAFFYDIEKEHEPLKCSSEICKLVPENLCQNNNNHKNKICGFNIKRYNGDGIKGYYLRDIVYFETDVYDDNKYKNKKKQNKTNDADIVINKKKVFRSYALPIGCTTEEEGKFKDIDTDGILGMSNSQKSVPDLLYNLGIINQNIFTLCFSLRGGYMSLGEIEKKYHRSNIINYIPLIESSLFYFIKLTSLKFDKSNNNNIIKVPLIAKIDTGNDITYFPSIIFKSITSNFLLYCENKNISCGNFSYEEKEGFCANYPNRESLFFAIYRYWPEIILSFGEKNYIWKPINYYYPIINITNNTIKACLGFNKHKSERVSLGSNFIHGHDFIFNRAEQKIGFVEANCDRENFVNYGKHKIGLNTLFEMSEPIKSDKEIYHPYFLKNNLSDNNNNDSINISFIEGHNTELDNKDFSNINFFILLTSIIFIAFIFIIVIFSLLFWKKPLRYENKNSEYISGNQLHNNEIFDNKITFEENKEENI